LLQQLRCLRGNQLQTSLRRNGPTQIPTGRFEVASMKKKPTQFQIELLLQSTSHLLIGESHYCGLAGDRRLARYSDYYALGCMLFELFNKDFFVVAQRKTCRFMVVVSAIAIDVNVKTTDDEKHGAWLENIRRFKHAIVVPDIGGLGSSVPRCIRAELNYVLRKLVSLDMADRIDDLEWLRRHITSAIHVLRARQREQERIAARRRR